MAQLDAAHTIERQTATISDTALTISTFGFTAANLVACDVAVVSCFSATVVFSDDGTNPTATDGHAIPPLAAILNVIGNDNINALRFIRQASTDVEVTITLKRVGRDV